MESKLEESSVASNRFESYVRLIVVRSSRRQWNENWQARCLTIGEIRIFSKKEVVNRRECVEIEIPGTE